MPTEWRVRLMEDIYNETRAKFQIYCIVWYK